MIKNIKDYKMIVEHDALKLNDLINEHLDNGWLLHGITYVYHIDDRVNGGYTCYFQAMIKV